jgi:hypothetical protein
LSQSVFPSTGIVNQADKAISGHNNGKAILFNGKYGEKRATLWNLRRTQARALLPRYSSAKND